MNDSERDRLIVETHTNVQTLLATSGDHETRLRSLEASGQSQKGAVAAVTAVISALWAIGTTIFFGVSHK